MIRFVNSIKKKYSSRYFAREEQWPPAKRDKLINLQLIETSRADSFSSSTSEDVRRTPLHHADIFHGKESVKHVKKVLVEGHAGIGKTTLSLMLSEEWAQGNIFQQFNCVLLLPLREKKVAEASSLLDLLRLLHASESIRSAVAMELEANEGEGLLIIADGWDELSEAARSKDSFLYDLLFGDIVPFASVLVTCRPSASSDIRNLPQIDRLVAVMGFDKEDVKAYINSEYKNDLHKYSRLLKQIESNPLLQSVCCIPLNCAITCHLWEVFHEELPSTMTTLYTQIILSAVYRSIKKYEEYSHILSLNNFNAIPENLQPVWLRLCEFAFNSITSNQVVFSMEELEIVLPEILTSDPKLSAFGLLQLSSSLLPVGHGLSASFLHLTFQEYLAALHISTLPTQQLISLCETYGASSHFAMVWRFLFGLLSSKDQNRKATSPRAPSIKEIVLSILKAFNRSSKKGSTLLLCHCAFEYQGQHITELISAILNDLINGNFPVAHNALDCAAICKVITNTLCCQSLILRMNGCGIEDNGLEWLTESLSNANGLLRVKHLDVTKNSISSNGIHMLFTRAFFAFSSLEQLCLSKNKIDHRGINAIFCLATTRQRYHSLTRLNLSDNPLAAAGFKELENAVLADSVPQLHSLDLSNTLTVDARDNSVALKSLTEALAINCSQLMAFSLSKNTLGVTGAEVLGRIMPKLTQRVSEFDLFLNDAQLGDDGLVAFVDSLPEDCKLFFFGIRHNDIHHLGLSTLAEKSFSQRFSCVVLDLASNPLGCKGTFQLSSMMSCERATVRHLYLSFCELTSPVLFSENFLRCSSMVQNNSITSLGLSGNCFSGERISFLAGLIISCVNNLKTLDTSNCQLTSDDLKSLLSTLHNSLSSTVLQQWCISDNEIDDIGAVSLVDSLASLFSRLNVVDINGNHVSVSMKASIQRCCRRNQKAMFEGLKTEYKVTEQSSQANTAAATGHKNTEMQIYDWWKKTKSVPEDKDLKEEFLRLWRCLLNVITFKLAEVVHPYTTGSLSEPVDQVKPVAIQNNATLSPKTIDPRVPSDSQTTLDSQISSDSQTTLDSQISIPNDSNKTNALNHSESHLMTSTSHLYKKLNAHDHLRQVIEAVWDVRSKWHLFGIALGIDPYTLDAINVKLRGDPDTCLRDMLQQWLNSESQVTWKALIDALETKSVGFLWLAQSLRDKYT